jgi:hypothetical protein
MQTLRQDVLDPVGVRFSREAEDTIIGKTRHKAPALHPGLNLLDKPFVQDMMQQYVGSYGRNDATLRRALVRVTQRSRLQHPGVEPCADQPQYAPIFPPLLHKRP